MSSVFQHISEALEQQGAAGVGEERIKVLDDRKRKLNVTFGLSYISQPETPTHKMRDHPLYFLFLQCLKNLHTQNKNTHIVSFVHELQHNV